MIKQILEYTVTSEGNKEMKAMNFLSIQDENMLDEISRFLKNFSYTKAIYNMMKGNFNDLLNFAKNLNSEEHSHIYFHANRYLINYLSMARLFIDKIEENIKQKYVDDPEIYVQFKELTSLEYDTSFAYRLLWELRNYTQHYGYPIHIIDSYIDQNNEKKTEIFISPEILIKGSFNWKPVVLEDLKNQVKPLNVFELIKEHILSLDRLYIFNLICYAEESLPFIEKYENFRKEHGYKGTLLVTEFKNIKAYRSAKIENYKNAKELGHERLINELIDELNKHNLIK